MTTFDTTLVHAGSGERLRGAAVPPIFRSTVFETGPGTDYDDIVYPRHSNLPTHDDTGALVAAVEGAEAGLVTSSGMSAITTTLLAFLDGNGHLLTQNSLYGGTWSFVTEDLIRFGGSYDFIDAGRPNTWRDKLRPDTKVIYTEGLTNPCLEIADHEAIVAFAREHGLKAIIDNTFPTPVNFRPLELGYDIVIHSATKYLNGHSDLVAGTVAGSGDDVEHVRHLLNHLGGCLDPHGCYLLARGMRTMSLRVARQNENALALARFLESSPAVARVNYPGLETHPAHARAKHLFSGFGGMLSFAPDVSKVSLDDFFARLELPVHGPSLGGLESLVIQPAKTSHVSLRAEDRLAMGVTDDLIRVSVGIEDVNDLIADFSRALGR